MAHESAGRPCSRRAFLSGTAVGTLAGGAAGWGVWNWMQGGSGGQSGQSPIAAPTLREGRKLGMPGDFAGRVIEVHHPGSVLQTQTEGYTKRDRQAVKAMVARGMQELVQSGDAVQAWRHFFKPGDRVGIKVVPVGKPDSISSYELIHEVVAGLQSAGVRLKDILVFERYKTDFLACKYPENLPDGVHWECSSAIYDELQVELDGQLPGRPREGRVAGYDPDIYRELAYCQPMHDPQDDRRFRSHVSRIISQKVDKFISLPVLKDHRSGGVTLSLKNLSHGSANNVARSHITVDELKKAGPNYELEGTTLNQCGTFIPAIASLPVLREKAVLQILDGLVGTYEGGPGNWNKTFATWQYKSLFFATDPVALDQVGWEIIDARRDEAGLPRISAMGLDAKTGVIEVAGKPYPEQFHIRQPQHVPLAATLGLGVFDPTRKKLEYRRIDLS
jgi:hypothetical protein